MAQLYHSGCGGAVASGLRVILRVVSFSILNGALSPGAVEARPSTESGSLKPGEEYSVTFFCLKCGKEFKTEEEFKTLESTCFVCGHRHPVAESVVTTHTSVSSKECLDTWLAMPDSVVPKSVKKIQFLQVLTSKHITV